MSNPSIPTKNTGDEVSAADINAIVGAFPTKLDNSFFSEGSVALVNGQATIMSATASVDALGYILSYAILNVGAGSLGVLTVLHDDIEDGVSFMIKSLNSSGTINTNDNSTIRWGIIGAV